MKILVYDVAAESGGALSILNKLYELAANVYTEHEWIFLISLPNLENCKNIIVRKFPEVKKGWLSRLKFDKKIAPNIIKEYNPDVVVNLQNVYVKTNCKQILYMHQILPFVNNKFSIFTETKLWIYKNIIGKMIISSCKKADEVIVQAKWIKDTIIKKIKLTNPNKISIKRPSIDKNENDSFTRVNPSIAYFYPASSEKYKNHEVILKALILLKKQGINKEVVFTLKGDENKNAIKLKKICLKEKLNVKFVGYLNKNEMMQFYYQSKVIFPSYIESFGLPLIEAKSCGCDIIASDLPFAHEACEGYDRVEFFEYKDYKKLANILAND